MQRLWNGELFHLFICSQAVDFTDYLNYNWLRLRGHIFINMKLKWPNYKYEDYKKRKEDIEVFISELSSYVFQTAFWFRLSCAVMFI